MTAPLDGIRVLDLATPRAELAGRVLADLGADVIKIEPPGGCDARRLPPFAQDDPADSLYWAAVGRGKRSIVLDLQQPGDRDRVRDLLSTADVLIESFAPGALVRLGLDYDTLAPEHPSLIYVSVSPFGQDAPEANAPATDLTIEAAGGLVSMQGDADRPPIPVGYPQAAFHAGLQAAADTVVALHERLRSGRGQRLDVSMQACMVWTLMNATGYPPNHGDDPPTGGRHRADPPSEIFPGLRIPLTLPCKDGFVTYHIVLPVYGGRTHQAMTRWMDECGMLPDSLRDVDWSNWIADVASGALPVERMIESVDALQAFFLTRTKREVQDFAARHAAIAGAVYDVADLLSDPQLIARDYWTDVGGRTHPGPFARLSRTPLTLERPAPALGADQHLLDAAATPTRIAGGAPPQSEDTAARRQAFDGIKVADFAWVGVGPLISKGLADHGATVVHVETQTRPDVLRLVPPYKDGEAGIDRAQFMANFNSSKLGCALNLATDEGRAIARKLIDWADVVVESFTPGTMASFGLDYDTLAKDRPDLIMLSTCLRGQTGPEAKLTGFGGQGACLAGLQYITGWPGRVPAGTWGAYTDFINPRFGLAGIAAALVHRARTGEGQHIDQAQTEAGIRFIEPLLLDHTVNGRVAGPAGHDSLYACPHGVYPADGHERWVALAVETAEQWQALLRLAPLADFADPALDELTARMQHRPALDAALRAWTAPQEPFTLARRLRDAGVPAYVVLWPSDLYQDPQLQQREFFVTLDHSEMGPTPYDGLATRFSATPGRLRKAAPCLGEDTDYVLRDLLHLPDDVIAAAAAAGALS